MPVGSAVLSFVNVSSKLRHFSHFESSYLSLSSLSLSLSLSHSLSLSLFLPPLSTFLIFMSCSVRHHLPDQTYTHTISFSSPPLLQPKL